MKNKNEVTPQTQDTEKVITVKPKKSLRPMRSMVAVRSLKPKMSVANLVNVKHEALKELN